MFHAHRLIPVSLAFAILGCHAQSSSDEDGRDDAFLHDGKSDTGGVSEGSPQAAGVLKLANTASEELLSDPTDGVGLAPKAVDNIMSFRLGDDSVPGTADDGVFHKLAELDAIPFVGPLAFAKLLRYAEAHGYISVRPAAMAQAREFFGAAVGLDGRVYVAGGLGANGPLADAEVYDPSTNTWTAIAPMSTPRAKSALVADARGHMIAIGGYADAPNGSTQILSFVEEYDPSANKWSPMPALPEGRYAASAAIDGDGALYVLGGMNDQPRVPPVLMLYASQIWGLGPQMATPRRGMAAVTSQDGRIYVVGGMAAGRTMTTGEVLDPATGHWVVLPVSPYGAYAPAATFGRDGQLIMLGGFDGRVVRDSVVAFDPVGNAWAARPSLPYRVYAASAAAVGDRVLLLGGDDGTGVPLARVSSFDPATQTWTTSDAPN